MYHGSENWYIGSRCAQVTTTKYRIVAWWATTLYPALAESISHSVLSAIACLLAISSASSLEALRHFTACIHVINLSPSLSSAAHAAEGSAEILAAAAQVAVQLSQHDGFIAPVHHPECCPMTQIALEEFLLQCLPAFACCWHPASALCSPEDVYSHLREATKKAHGVLKY
jgi:hypothetical protein